MNLDQIRIAARMIIEGHPEKVIVYRLGITPSRFQRHRNEIMFEVGLRRAGIVNITEVERVA